MKKLLILSAIVMMTVAMAGCRNGPFWRSWWAVPYEQPCPPSPCADGTIVPPVTMTPLPGPTTPAPPTPAPTH